MYIAQVYSAPVISTTYGYLHDKCVYLAVFALSLTSDSREYSIDVIPDITENMNNFIVLGFMICFFCCFVLQGGVDAGK